MEKSEYKVLIVEDEKLMLELLVDRFAKETQFKVFTATNGQEGLESATTNHPDLIMLDISMPVMDGVTMSKELYKRSGTNDIKIIFLTNFDTNDDILKQISENVPAFYLIKANTNLEDIVKKAKEALGIWHESR